MEIKEEKSLSENNTQKVISIIKGQLVEMEGRMNQRIDDKVSLPSFTIADNGKVLGIVNGELAWVVANVSDNPNTPTDPTPPIDEPDPIEPTEIVHVGIGSEYTYHTIKDAEKAVADGGKIVIHEGEYEEYSIGTVDKVITYEGVDKDTCIVYNGWSDKEYSVFNLSKGNKTVKNLTIHQTHENPKNPTVESVAFKAYAVHSDTSSCEGHTYVIDNCILKNKYFACCGFGMWKDHTITVKDCDLDLYDDNGKIADMGAYYCHNNTTANGITGQRINLINNTIHGNQSKAIRIDVATQDGSEMICEFINNKCSSDLYGETSACVSFGTNEHTRLTETSTGNNISVLNYGVSTTYTAPEGLKDTGYWFVCYDKTSDEYYAVNSTALISRVYKHPTSAMLAMTIASGTAKNNAWVSEDGINWNKKLTDSISYNATYTKLELSTGMYNNKIDFVDAWSDTEFSWDY